MNQFKATFDFTTVTNSGRFTGRSGQVCFESKQSMKQVMDDSDGVKNMVHSYIHHEKPKWNVLMIEIKEIRQLNTKPANPPNQPII